MITKSDIVSSVAQSTGATKTQAETFVNATIEAISASLIKKDDVRLHGFGTFSAKATPARKGRNPSTGESIDVAASVKVGFKVASDLKAKL